MIVLDTNVISEARHANASICRASAGGTLKIVTIWLIVRPMTVQQAETRQAIDWPSIASQY